MNTTHKIIYDNASNMKETKSESIDLIVTSPPYPMIEMWDEQFAFMNPNIKKALESDSSSCFNLMHEELNKTWKECYRVLKNGGVACINIGDATRKFNSTFRLFPNHARIISDFEKLGFTQLPSLIWRKQTNKPNKFMGSGTLPVNAYVTLEHEFILVFRKGLNRVFENKEKRRKSSFFWEERNKWFSDMWFDLKGTNQLLNHKELRERSAAYPFELPFRLINMYSVLGDTVLDPFLGTGTTTSAAMHLCRNSVGYEIEKDFQPVIENRLDETLSLSPKLLKKRLSAHMDFVENRKKPLKYKSKKYGFPVMTRQELEIAFSLPINYAKRNNEFQVCHEEIKNLNQVGLNI